MTVESTNNRNQYSTNGTTGPWTVSFYFLTEGSLDVTYTDADGVETALVLNTDYTVTGEGDPAGGTITTTTAYASGGLVTILLDPSPLQETDYVETDSFPAASHERELDRLTQRDLQQDERYARSLHFPVSDISSAELPSAAARALKTLTFDADGDLTFTTPAEGTAAALAADLIDDSVSTNGAGMVGYSADITYVDTTLGGHVAAFIYVDADYATASDGTTDDSTKIAQAFTRAASTGALVLFNGSVTYALGSQLVIPAGAKIKTNGCTFKDLNGVVGSTPLVTIDDNVHIDTLTISVPTGKTRERAVSISGDDVRIDGSITVTYADQQAATDNDDAAVRITASNRVSVGGFIRVTKNDRGVQIHTSSEVTIGGLAITSYVRGLLIEDSSHVHIGRSKMGTLSANGSYTAGHVGVLLQCNTTDLTRNVTLEDFVIEDAGEHGIRLGGPEQMSNIYLVRTRTKNCGGSGIKILGTDSGTPTAFNSQISILDPIIEDCGTGGLTTNMCGLLIMFAVNVTITNPRIRKQTKLQSGYHGIRLCAVSDVDITSPDVADGTSDNIVVDATLGDCSRINISGGITRVAGRDGIRALTGTGTIRRLIVDGLTTDSNAGYGAFFTASGGTAVACKFRTLAYNDTSGPASCDSTAVTWNGSGVVSTSGPVFASWSGANGSLWQDEGDNTYVLKATVWTAVA